MNRPEVSAVSCPCCGAPIDGAVPLIEVPRVAKLSLKQAAIFYALAHRPSDRVPMERLTYALYAHDPNGGPENAEDVVRVHVALLRKKIEPLGWSANAHGNSGYALVAVTR